MELEPKFGQIIHKTKSTYFNTANPSLQWNQSQNLVKLYTKQNLHITTQLLQGSSGTRAKMVKLYTRQSLYATTQLLQGSSGTRAKVWSKERHASFGCCLMYTRPACSARYCISVFSAKYRNRRYLTNLPSSYLTRCLK